MIPVKHIEIQEPIWRPPRSVGLNVSDCPLECMIEVDIMYTKKNGERTYPSTFSILAEHVRMYPDKKLKSGIIVNIVPISDLKITGNKAQNSQLNLNNMLFDKGTLDKVVKESEEQKNKSFDSRPNTVPGKHKLILKEIVMDKAKDGNPMAILVFSEDEEHRDIREYYKLDGPNTSISRERLVKAFHRGFGYEIQECENEAQLLQQLKPFEGNVCTAAVRGKKRVISAKNDKGTEELKEITSAEVWYIGLEAEFDDFYVDPAKLMVELSADDKDKLVQAAELSGQVITEEEKPIEEAPEEVKEEATPEIPEEAPAPEEKPPEAESEPAPEPAPEEEKKEEEDNDTEDDQLPF